MKKYPAVVESKIKIEFKDLSWPLRIGIIGGLVYALLFIAGFIYGFISGWIGV